MALLELIGEIVETPTAEYPSPTKFDEEIIKQLMSFREKRATKHLRRIAAFDPKSSPASDNPFKRNRILTVALAIEALAAIEQDEALDQLKRAIDYGIMSSNTDDYSESNDEMAPIRYHAVLGLKHCSTADAKMLLEHATNDPHSEIRAFAGEILANKNDA